MNFKNLIWLAAMLAVCIGVISVFAQDEPIKPDDQNQQNQENQQNQQGQQGLQDDKQGLENQQGLNQQGSTSISGTIYCVLDDQGNVKSCEIRDEKGTSYTIHNEGLGKDLYGLTDAKVRAMGRVMDSEGKKTFHIESFEATVGIAGKLVERDNSVVLEEINFQGSPKKFKVLNGKEEVEKLGVPFDKEIKANGTIVKGNFNASQFREGEGQFPREGVTPGEGTMPEEGTRPEEGTMPEEGTRPEEGIKPEEGTRPEEGVKPEEGTKPEEGVKPEDDTLPRDDQGMKDDASKDQGLKDDQSVQDDTSKDHGLKDDASKDQSVQRDASKDEGMQEGQMDRERQGELDRQAGLDKQAGLGQASEEWTIRISSYEPLEYIVGVVSSEKGDAGDMQIRLEEEEKGIIFKEKGRTFEVASMGKGQELRKYEGQKIKAYGTLSKNQQGSWLLHVLAYQPEEGKEGQDNKGQEESKDDESKKHEEGAPDKE